MMQLPWAILSASGLLLMFATELMAGPAPQSQPPMPVITSLSSVVSPPDTRHWSGIVLARPLFRSSRRPLPALIATGAASAPLPRLSAIVISAAGRSAIFIGDDGSVNVVMQGGWVGGYQVERILPDQLRLSGPSGTRTLRPQLRDNTAAPAPPPPAGPPAIGLPSSRFPDGPL